MLDHSGRKVFIEGRQGVILRSEVRTHGCRLATNSFIFNIFFSLPYPFCQPTSAQTQTTPQIFASSSSSVMDNTPKKLTDFPFVSSPHRNLMIDLVSTLENRLQSHLKPCTLPSDVQYFYNQSGTSQGSLHIRSGLSSSQVDFILGSWLHCQLPTGAALNITTLAAFLKAFTDAPNVLLEFIQSSPTSLVPVMDLPPRKDLVLYPDYLQTFYENTKLDSLRQTLADLPEVQPYYSALYNRCLTSPTAILIRVNTEGAEAGRMEEIIKDHVDPVVKEAFGIWLDQCACVHRNVDEAEKALLEKRDRLSRSKAIELDLVSSFPRMFGPDVANRVLQVMKEVYNV